MLFFSTIRISFKEIQDLNADQFMEEKLISLTYPISSDNNKNNQFVVLSLLIRKDKKEKLRIGIKSRRRQKYIIFFNFLTLFYSQQFYFLSVIHRLL